MTLYEGAGGNVGSSPRLRGTPFTHRSSRLLTRIIPAPAGNTTRGACCWPRQPDHPRACGEHSHHEHREPRIVGSSPRLRGTQKRHRPQAVGRRIIPAPAGNTRDVIFPTIGTPDHPRACGEHNSSVNSTSDTNGSSPCLRGTRQKVHCGSVIQRIIPAPAGNTRTRDMRDAALADHPRACGEHDDWAYLPETVYGSSPRLRGTPTSDT